MINKKQKKRASVKYNLTIFKIIAGISVLSIIVLLTINFKKHNQYSEEQFIKKTVIADNELLLIDTVRTNQRINNNLSHIGFFFDYYPQTYPEIIQKIESSFQRFHQEKQALREKEKNYQKKIHSVASEFFNKQKELERINKQLLFYQTYFNTKYGKTFSDNGTNSLKTHTRSIINIIEELQQQQALSEKQLQFLQKDMQQHRAEYKSNIENIREQFSVNLKKLIQVLNVSNFPEITSYLSQDKTELLIKNNLVDILSSVKNRMILPSPDILENSDAQKTPVIFNLETQERIYLSNQQIVFIDDIKKEIPQIIDVITEENNSGALKNILATIIENLIAPTLSLNKKEFEKRRQDVIENTSSLYSKVKKGQILAEKGEKLNAKKAQLLNAYSKKNNDKYSFTYITGIVILIFFSVVILYHIFRREKRSVDSIYRNIALIFCIVAINLIIILFGKLFVVKLNQIFQFIDYEFLHYLLPINLAILLLASFRLVRVSLYIAVVSALFVTILLNENFIFFLFYLLPCFGIVLPIYRFNTRFELIINGGKLALLKVFSLSLLYLIYNKNFDILFLEQCLIAGVGALITTILFNLLFPIFEKFFNITTNLKLLELANMSHPLLQTLLSNAPGTFHHSIVVSNLAETAAQAIYARPLLCRVASYYHDIGKIKEPQYFNENYSIHGNEAHVYLDEPSKSAQKIIEHLTIGIEFAKKYKLGKSITDVICQHHGTSLVKFFFQEAKNKYPEETIEETLFRYPGIKPQTREAVIVMLADSCEAATRSLEIPNANNIIKIVKQCITGFVDDGQFDEVELRISEIKAIENSLIKSLTSIYHSRNITSNKSIGNDNDKKN